MPRTKSNATDRFLGDVGDRRREAARWDERMLGGEERVTSVVKFNVNISKEEQRNV